MGWVGWLKHKPRGGGVGRGWWGGKYKPRGVVGGGGWPNRHDPIANKLFYFVFCLILMFFMFFMFLFFVF